MSDLTKEQWDRIKRLRYGPVRLFATRAAEAATRNKVCVCEAASAYGIMSSGPFGGYSPPTVNDDIGPIPGKVLTGLRMGAHKGMAHLDPRCRHSELWRTTRPSVLYYRLTRPSRRALY